MRHVIALSGGLDSAVLLSLMVKQLKAQEIELDENLIAVNFQYGSKHNAYEATASRELASWYQVDHIRIDLTPIFNHYSGKSSSLLAGGGNIPEGHYTSETMKSTVVPGRNLIFASILAGLAASGGTLEQGEVHLGIHAGDHAIYPDCRPDFYRYLNQTVKYSTEGKVDVAAPFLMETKVYIVSLGHKNKVPFELSRTCYKDQKLACGKCGSCVERREAFALNSLVDPVQYQ